MASPYTKLQDRIVVLEKDFAVIKASVAEHESDLDEFKKSIDALKDTVSKWSGALLIAGPILTFIASYIASMAAP